jgi:hypothetical protein
MGKVMLSLLAAFAQYYSDNLSHETKKGRPSARRRGGTTGASPSVSRRTAAGSRSPTPRPTPGLLLAFQAAATASPTARWRSCSTTAATAPTGGWGRRPFSKDTVRPLLQNRFYSGELPDGDGGWVGGAHEAVLDDALFDAGPGAARPARHEPAAGARGRGSTPSPAAECPPLRRHAPHPHGRRAGRVYCYRDRQAARNGQRSTFLAVYEDQIARTWPPSRSRRTTGAAPGRAGRAAPRRRGDEQRTPAPGDAAGQRRVLFDWGHQQGDYWPAGGCSGRFGALRRRTSWAGPRAGGALLPISRIVAAADQGAERLARLLFEEVALKTVGCGVKPQPTFAPFFALDCQARRLSGGSDGGRIRACELSGATLFRPFPVPALSVAPVAVPAPRQHRPRVPRACWPEIARRVRHESLRELAMEYDVSYETIRAIVHRVRSTCSGVGAAD